jgi:hypothetical protein
MSALRRRCRPAAFAAVLLAGAALVWSAAAAGQDATYFTPTYAASQGSPYSEVYARTFGAPPIVTAAPAPPAAPTPSVVYVIEDGRLLTYSAEVYARGGGEPLAGAPLPTTPTGGRLYGAVPPQAAAGSAGHAPIPLLPN